MAPRDMPPAPQKQSPNVYLRSGKGLLGNLRGGVMGKSRTSVSEDSLVAELGFDCNGARGLAFREEAKSVWGLDRSITSHLVFHRSVETHPTSTPLLLLHLGGESKDCTVACLSLDVIMSSVHSVAMPEPDQVFTSAFILMVLGDTCFRLGGCMELSLRLRVRSKITGESSQDSWSLKW